jgi:site-specific recombinase XerC
LRPGQAQGQRRRARRYLAATSNSHPAEDGAARAFEITEPTRDSLSAWLARRGKRQDDWLFPSRSRPGDHVSTRQYARLVGEWVAKIDLEPRAYGTHSLRRTKVALVYKKTGNLRACQLLLGHRKLESKVRYLGIEVDDALEISEQIEI